MENKESTPTAEEQISLLRLVLAAPYKLRTDWPETFAARFTSKGFKVEHVRPPIDTSLRLEGEYGWTLVHSMTWPDSLRRPLDDVSTQRAFQEFVQTTVKRVHAFLENALPRWQGIEYADATYEMKVEIPDAEENLILNPQRDRDAVTLRYVKAQIEKIADPHSDPIHVGQLDQRVIIVRMRRFVSARSPMPELKKMMYAVTTAPGIYAHEKSTVVVLGRHLGLITYAVLEYHMLHSSDPWTLHITVEFSRGHPVPITKVIVELDQTIADIREAVLDANPEQQPVEVAIYLEYYNMRAHVDAAREIVTYMKRQYTVLHAHERVLALRNETHIIVRVQPAYERRRTLLAEALNVHAPSGVWDDMVGIVASLLDRTRE